MTQFNLSIPIEVVDNTAQLANVQARMSAFEKTIQGTQARLAQLNGSKSAPVLSVQDRATAIIKEVSNSVRALAGHVVTIPIRAIDLASSVIGRIMNTLTSPLAMLGVGLGAAGIFESLVKWPLAYAGTLEQAQIAFTNLFRSAPQASAFLTGLQDWTMHTQFQFSQTQAVSQGLASSGMAMADIMPTLAKLSNVAAVSTDPSNALDVLARVKRQSMTQRLMSSDILESLDAAGLQGRKTFMEPGVLTKEGLSMYSLEKMLAAGMVPAQQAMDAYLAAMQRKFPNAAKEMGYSWIGMMATVSDTFKLSGVQEWALGIKSVIQPQLKVIVDWLSANKATVAAWSAEIKKAGVEVGNFVVNNLSSLYDGFDRLTNSSAWKMSGSLGDKLKLVWDSIVAQPFDTWWNGAGKVWAATAANTIGTGIGSLVGGALWAVLGADTGGAQDVGHTVGASFLTGFLNALAPGKDSPLASWANLWAWMTTASPQMTSPGVAVGSNLRGSINAALSDHLANPVSTARGTAPTSASFKGHKVGGMSYSDMLPAGSDDTSAGSSGFGLLDEQTLRLIRDFSDLAFELEDMRRRSWGSGFGGSSGDGGASTGISGGGFKGMEGSSGSGLGSAILNQFDLVGTGELSASDAATACGPVAAVSFARAMGRNPTMSEAMALARKVGWRRGAGMAGGASEVALLRSMGINAQEGAGSASALTAALAGGGSAIIDTPKHYYDADKYDSATDRYHVGGSGRAMRGGSDWMTWSDITRLGGGIDGLITATKGTGANQNAVTVGPGAVVVNVQHLPTDPAAINKFATLVADPLANAIATHMEHAAANTVPTR